MNNLFGHAPNIPARIIQIEPMGREILYVVESSMGEVRVLEAGSTARQKIDEQLNLVFSSDNTLLFQRESGDLMAGAHFNLQ